MNIEDSNSSYIMFISGSNVIVTDLLININNIRATCITFERKKLLS